MLGPQGNEDSARPQQICTVMPADAGSNTDEATAATGENEFPAIGDNLIGELQQRQMHSLYIFKTLLHCVGPRKISARYISLCMFKESISIESNPMWSSETCVRCGQATHVGRDYGCAGLQEH